MYYGEGGGLGGLLTTSTFFTGGVVCQYSRELTFHCSISDTYTLYVLLLRILCYKKR
jgi:hypothetical protein